MAAPALLNGIKNDTISRNALCSLYTAHTRLQGREHDPNTLMAIVNKNGMIVAVNQAWEAFARENGGGTNTGTIGTSYLAACNSAGGAATHEAQAFSHGLSAVLSGECSRFEVESTCHSPNEQRWTVATVVPAGKALPGHVIVAHSHTTLRIGAYRDDS